LEEVAGDQARQVLRYTHSKTIILIFVSAWGNWSFLIVIFARDFFLDCL